MKAPPGQENNYLVVLKETLRENRNGRCGPDRLEREWPKEITSQTL